MNPGLPGAPAPSPALDAALREALARQPAGYTPHTRHLEANGRPTFVNRLIRETSPYLLQHAHNPVNWFPWGAEAFAQARALNKPILLSIGYSTCHWCHVMERESFEDLEIAAVINELYVPIKVDREERPDLDDTYMAAVQLLTGRGGWPMTVALTPAREPFFGGTYFPPRDGERGAGKGFLTVLRELSQAWAQRHEQVLSNATTLSQAIRQAAEPAPPAGVPGPELLHATARSLMSGFDAEWGGFGSAPKFPRPVTLDFLLRYYRRSGDPKALEVVTTTLRKMREGGLFDQLGGGFHRYSTDREWLVPHFEKMLYDNAQLAPVYLSAWQLTGDPLFLETARATLDWVEREMTSPEGGFYSATDADSRGPSGHDEEGAWFTWTPAELQAALDPEDAAFAQAWFGVTGPAHVDGRWVLHRPTAPPKALAEPMRLQAERVQKKLLEVRATRPRPRLDDKVVTAWNGLMISAFARGALVTADPTYLAAARTAADLVLRKLQGPDGRLRRSYRAGIAQGGGFLDDYAFFIQGLLNLFEASGEQRWLSEAVRLQAVLDGEFADQSHGGYDFTSTSAESLLRRERPTYDGAEPSGNSVALLNLLRLETLTGAEAYRSRVNGALEGFSTVLRQQAEASPLLLSGLEASLDAPVEVFVITSPGSDEPTKLLAAVRKTYLPNGSFLRVTEGQQLEQLVPALEGKRAREGRATAYVCERGLCELPTEDPQVLSEQLSRVRRPLPAP